MQKHDKYHGLQTWVFVTLIHKTIRYETDI
jgi:hypothetical protein